MNGLAGMSVLSQHILFHVCPKNTELAKEELLRTKTITCSENKKLGQFQRTFSVCNARLERRSPRANNQNNASSEDREHSQTNQSHNWWHISLKYQFIFFATIHTLAFHRILAVKIMSGQERHDLNVPNDFCNSIQNDRIFNSSHTHTKPNLDCNTLHLTVASSSRQTFCARHYRTSVLTLTYRVTSTNTDKILIGSNIIKWS